MTDSKLSLLVSEAVKLDREIRQKTKTLDEYKKTLVAEAESRADEAVKTEGGGRSIQFEGLDGCIARVTKAGPTLASSFNPEQAKFAKIKALVGQSFLVLFEAAVVYKVRPNFRDRAAEIVGANSAKLIKALTTPGKTSVAFETKESEA